jgi:hypothetical protein
MEDRDTSNAHDSPELLHEQPRIGHERGYPAAPGEIVGTFRQTVCHQIELVNLHVAKVAGAAPLLQRAHEITRALESDDLARRADDLSQVHCGVTRPGAEVEDAAADRDSGSLPAIQGDRTPNPMLNPSREISSSWVPRT